MYAHKFIHNFWYLLFTEYIESTLAHISNFDDFLHDETRDLVSVQLSETRTLSTSKIFLISMMKLFEPCSFFVLALTIFYLQDIPMSPDSVPGQVCHCTTKLHYTVATYI